MSLTKGTVPLSANSCRLGHKSFVAPTLNGGVVGTRIGLDFLLGSYWLRRKALRTSGSVFSGRSSSLSLMVVNGQSYVSATYLSKASLNFSSDTAFFLESLVRSRIFH